MKIIAPDSNQDSDRKTEKKKFSVPNKQIRRKGKKLITRILNKHWI